MLKKSMKKIVVSVLAVVMVLGFTFTAMAETYTVTGTKNFLALRSAQKYDAANIIGKLYNGDTVDVIETKGDYWKVSALGKTGYVDKKYLTKGTIATTTYTVSGTKNFLALRSERKYDSKNIIGKLYNGDKVEVVDTKGTYWAVKALGKSGYVDSRYLVKGSVTPPANTYKVSGTKNFLALRSSQKYDANNIIGKLYNGDTVEVLSTSGDYWKVKALGKTGYVDKRFLVKK